MEQSSGTKETEGLKNNTDNVPMDEVAVELKNISLKLGTIEKKIDKITPGSYTTSWRDFEK